MSDIVVCPICETENEPDATHCEVCGERLTPAEPGEELSPEENVSAMVEESTGDADEDEAEDFVIEGGGGGGFASRAAESTEVDGGIEKDVLDEDDGEEVDLEGGEAAEEEFHLEGEEAAEEEFDLEGEEAAEEEFDLEGEEAAEEEFDLEGEEAADGEFDLDGEEAAEGEAVAGEFDLEGEEAAEGEFDLEGEEAAEEEFDLEGEEAAEGEFDLEEESGALDVSPAEEGVEVAEAGEPDVLYSPHDGTAYPEGTPEYEEGFGPMGEQLVAEPPEGLEGDLGEPMSDVAPAGDEDELGDIGSEPMEDELVDSGQPEVAGGPSERFMEAFQPRSRKEASMEPLPTPGTHVEPATLTVYVNREPVLEHPVEADETLIGRRDPVSDSYPDVDLTEWDEESHVSRKHAYIYRQNKNYTLYVVSNAGTQLGDEMLELGDRRKLSDEDVIVLAGKVAMKFDLPEE